MTTNPAAFTMPTIAILSNSEILHTRSYPTQAATLNSSEDTIFSYPFNNQQLSKYPKINLYIQVNYLLNGSVPETILSDKIVDTTDYNTTLNAFEQTNTLTHLHIITVSLKHTAACFQFFWSIIDPKPMINYSNSEFLLVNDVAVNVKTIKLISFNRQTLPSSL
jgi:hypothetical protein